MAETPVPSLILSLSVSTVITMLVATTYNIVATYFVADLGESAVAAVGLMFSVMALIQAVGYTWGWVRAARSQGSSGSGIKGGRADSGDGACGWCGVRGSLGCGIWHIQIRNCKSAWSNGHEVRNWRSSMEYIL
ncbi:MAG: hypothetical protein ACLTDF_09560 [Coprococcus sp.]